MARDLYFLTRSTTVDALTSDKYDSSSVAYEVALIRALSSQARLTVINCSGREKEIEKLGTDSPYVYLGMGGGRIVSILRTLWTLCAIRVKGGRPCVLTTGYYPLEMMALVLMRVLGTHTFSIIFDSHRSAAERLNSWRRGAVDLYFNFGLACAGLLSGVLLVNSLAISKFPILPRRTLLTRIGGVPEGRQAQKSPLRTSGPRLLFAGTLNAENGVHILLEALAIKPRLPCSVVICGSGDAEESVRTAAAADSRITFVGRIQDAQLNGQILESDYLICLRDPDCIAAEFAFPSKLIKFMASGIPVLANRFPGVSEEMAECILAIEEFNANSLADSIALLSEIDFRGVGARAEAFVQARHSWSAIAEEIVAFLFAPD